MKKMTNNVVLAGQIYDYDLRVGEYKADSDKAGQKWISGTVSVVTDIDGANVVQARFFASELTKKKTNNPTFGALETIMAENKTVLEVGLDNAMIIEVNSSMKLNDFVGRDGEIVSPKMVNGGFINIIDKGRLAKIHDRNIFTLDLVITKALRIEADEEKGTKEHVRLSGYAFDYNNALLPTTFSVISDRGMNYFEDAEPTGKEPLFTKVWGVIKNESISYEKKEETAFGDEVVTVVTRDKIDWVVTKAAKVPYEFDEEDVLTREEMKKGIQDRDIYLATVKQKDEDYKASRAGGAAKTASTLKTDFDF